eukprot:TRINITY_DN8281_c0_g1_i1.p1 TRINITY_DN8281_c0_g1~~TRINITY_DN8281_c0_g1_i1.p1  ORF type:complete len:703 (-),score=113.98 TRINITY_DN8281_c0_g1_i1:13-2121(-)
MDYLSILTSAIVVVFALSLYLFNKPRPPKEDNNKYGLPVPGPANPRETVCYRRKEDLEELISTPPEFQTIYDVMKLSSKRYPESKCLGTRPVLKIFEEEKTVGGEKRIFTFPQLGPYQWESYATVYQRMKNFASGLRSLGMKPKDFLAMFEETRAEWTIASRAAYMQSITLFTVYANLGEEALIYALQEGEIAYIFTNGKLLKQILKIIHHIKNLSTVIYCGDVDNDAKNQLKSLGLVVVSFVEVEKMGINNPFDDVPPKPDDLACIMYTSGSTGKPKGVMTTHRNLVVTLSAMAKPVKFDPKSDRYLGYLPLAHSLAFVLESLAMYFNLPIGYGNPRTLADAGVRLCKGDLEEFRPTIFVAVPVIFEKIKHGMELRVNKNFITRTLFKFGYRAKLAAFRTGQTTPIWDWILFNKFKQKIGGKVRVMLTGSAPLNPMVHKFIRVCFGVPFVQGYGLTETCSAGTVMDLEDLSNNTIGPPLGCCEIKLVDVPEMNYFTTPNPPRSPFPTGEVYIRGDNVCVGYYKDEKSKESFLPDKWFATGDIGMVLPNGTFRIIDRKKNLIKPSHGEYIALEKLESAYRTCRYVEIVCVYASSDRYHVVAVVAPNRATLDDWARKNSISTTNFDNFCKDKRVVQFMLKELIESGKKGGLKRIEMLRNVRISPYDWTPENHMLTTAMKLNRNEVYYKWRSEIKEMYNEIEEK